MYQLRRSRIEVRRAKLSGVTETKAEEFAGKLREDDPPQELVRYEKKGCINNR